MEQVARSFRKSAAGTVHESELVLSFAARSKHPRAPLLAMAEHVLVLRESVGSSFSRFTIDQYLNFRNIKERKLMSDLACDGYLEPQGGHFVDGFRIALKQGVPQTRMYFTVAHEICHTFFYELVPEIKFSPHDVDAFEERLCNYGAVCLLMPADEVCARAKNLPMGVSSLEDIAGVFGVSLDTAILRLRSLRLWKCEFSTWHRMTTGDFVMNRLYGYQDEDWRWTDEEFLQKLWTDEEGTIKTGRTFVDFEIPHGHPAAKRVFYQAKRRGDLVIALWRTRPFPEPLLPLLADSRPPRRKARF